MHPFHGVRYPRLCYTNKFDTPPNTMFHLFTLSVVQYDDV